MPADSVRIYENQSSNQSSYAGVPIRQDAVYTNHKGEERERIRKRAQKGIDGLQEALRKVLEPGEVLFYLAPAYLPANSLDQLFLGAVASYTERGFLVFTSRRLLFFLVARNGSWKRCIRTARWGDVETLRVKGLLGPKVEMRYRSGAKEVYWRLRRADAKKIRSLMTPLLEACQGEQSAAQGVVHLCPECLEPLRPGRYQCAKCGLEFKNERTMVVRAWLLPGIAYFYAGHRGLAVWQFIIEAVLLLEIVIGVATATGAIPAERPGLSRNGAWLTVGFFTAVLVIERLFTVRHCRRFVREYIPGK